MIRSASMIVAALLAAPLASAQWALVWSDEFDGDAVNLNNWEFQIGDGSEVGLPAGWGNNELQWYTDQNAEVSDGTLKITALRNFPEFGWAYSSTRLRTKGLHSFLYGRIEASIKLPSGEGIWPAFWMLPEDSPYGGWAASGEIDIMESVNFADRAYQNLYYGDNWPNMVSFGSSTTMGGTDFSANFHTYGIEWEEDVIRWYLDGQLVHTVTSNVWFSAAAPGNQRAPFDVPFHLLLNVAVGGNFPGPPNGAVGFPMTMEVDWVRVYESVPIPQDPYLGTPAPIPGQIEAENYDFGGQGIAYNDFDTTNNGGAYRPGEGVDLEAASGGGSGFNVGWIRQGEWIEYTVDVAQAGEYILEASVASQSTGGIYRFEFDGVDKTGVMQAPITGGWQSWQQISANVQLDAGVQVMRFVNLGGATSQFNFDYINITAVPAPACTGDINDDGVTDVFDFSDLAANFGAGPGATREQGDVTGDGFVDVFDFSDLAADFGCVQ